MGPVGAARTPARPSVLEAGGAAVGGGARTVRGLAAAVVLLLAGLLAALAARQVQSVDVGFHLKTGEWILAEKAWPRTDQFTFTVRDHPYVDPSWGYDVAVALVNRSLGAPGLVLFHAALALATFVVVWRTTRLAPADPAVLSIAMLLAVLAAEMRFLARPELLSYLLLALVLHILQRRANGRPAPLWVLAPLLLVWANVHGTFALGWLAEACFIVGLAIRDRRIDWKLASWSAASAAAVLANPYGWRAVGHLLTLATRFEGRNVFAQSIGELLPPFSLRLSEQLPFYPRSPVIAFRIFVLLSLLALIPALKRRRFEAVLVGVAFAALSFRMLRNVPLFVLAFLPAAAWWMPGGGLIERLGAGVRAKSWLRRATLAGVGLAAVIVGVRAVTDAHYIASRRTERFGLGWNRLALPVDAAEFARANGLRGPVFNDLAFGGYLMWALPDPVFIDSRLEVMGEQFFEEYRRALESPEALEAEVARYGIRWLILQYTSNGGFLARLSADPQWDLVRVDPLAAIFVRVDGRRPLGAATALPPRLPDVRSVDGLPGVGGVPRRGVFHRWLAGLAARERYPSEDVNLGLFEFFRGDMGQAAARFDRAIRTCGGAYYELYYNLGLALDALGRREEARACFAVVLADDPRNRTALERVRRSAPD